LFRQSTLDGSNDIPSPNNPPAANAGPDQQVDEDTLVTLDGTASSDSDGTIASYAWLQTAGPSVTLSDSTAPQPTFTAPLVDADTTLTFPLVVTDDDAEPSVADTVDVLVQDVPVPPSATTGALIADIESMNLQHGVESSLIAPLKQAQKLLDDENTGNDEAVCNKSSAFTNIVDAKEKNGQLTSDQAEELRQLATQIEVSLGC